MHTCSWRHDPRLNPLPVVVVPLAAPRKAHLCCATSAQPTGSSVPSRWGTALRAWPGFAGSRHIFPLQFPLCRRAGSSRSHERQQVRWAWVDTNKTRPDPMDRRHPAFQRCGLSLHDAAANVRHLPRYHRDEGACTCLTKRCTLAAIVCSTSSAQRCAGWPYTYIDVFPSYPQRLDARGGLSSDSTRAEGI